VALPLVAPQKKEQAMPAHDVFVIVNLPSDLPEDSRQRLVAAHPRAEVALVDDPGRFAELLPRADGAMLMPTLAPLLGPALRPGGRLRWLHSVPAGAEGLLTPEVVAAGHVALTCTKGPQGPMVAEHALLLMLALARDLPGYARNQEARRWQVPAGARPMRDLFGKTVLILGVGGTGGHLARTCRVGLGMRVLGMARTRRDDPHVDRYVEPGELHAALGEADFVVLCLALTPQTRGIIDARGGVVDEAALVAALQAGRIAGAGLDTMAVEPLPQENPLWAMPNVIITPHMANARDSALDHGFAFMRENIRRFAEGEPLLGVVDRDARY
jgi:phosphoglycerate dehydrogenase-like enzyme